MTQSADGRPTVSYSKPAGNYGSLECGQRLYYKGMKIAEEKKRKCNEMKKRLEEEEGKELTFKPQINANATNLSGRSIENSLIIAG